MTATLATFDDYLDIMADRPVKLTPAEVLYSPSPKFDQICGECVHFFRSPAAKRTVCEIMRPETDTENVSHVGYCAFWTADYHTFPLLHLLDIDKEPEDA